MPKCVTIRRKHSAVCIGDLRDEIILHARDIATPAAGSVDFGETLSAPPPVWAAVETMRGEDVFNGTELVGTATHRFYIRYLSGVTSARWVEFNSQYYRVLDVTDLEGRGEWLVLRCNLRGTTANAANLA